MKKLPVSCPRLISLGRAVLLPALIALAGCGPENTFVAPPPPQVGVARPIIQDVTTYEDFVGRTKATATTDILARVPGYLRSTEFKAGQMVEAGALLFTIEDEPYRAALQAAEGRLEQAKAKAALARTTLERREQLFKQSAISELDLLTARAETAGAEAAVSEAEAAVEKARIDLSYTQITAPLSGRITRAMVDPGNLVGPGAQTMLASISQDDPIHVYFEADERAVVEFLGKLPRSERPGAMPSDLIITLTNGVRFGETGTINYAGNQINPQTGTLELRAVFPNPERQIVPGLFVRVGIPATVEKAILVPEDVVQRDIGGKYVLVVGEDNMVERRAVETGPQYQALRIIRSGLAGDERIVVSGVQRARPGAPVNPVEKQ